MSVQQADQPPLVYPVSTEPSPPSHPQPDGSFGAVFIVLAIIVVISAIACFLGRFCNKRYNNPKPYYHSRHVKEKDMKPNRNAFQTKDGEIEFGFDKRFSSAKVANNGEPNMGRPNSFREQNMGQPNSFNEPNMGRPNSVHEPNMGRSNSFPEPNMGPDVGRPNSYREHLGPNLGQPSSFREPPMGRTDSFHEPYMGRPDSFRKGEFRDDQMRFSGDEDHQTRFNSRTRPSRYY